jgi:hypothetical protein
MKELDRLVGYIATFWSSGGHCKLSDSLRRVSVLFPASFIQF